MTDIKEPINTTSDGTFLSVVCENPKKVLLSKSWGAVAPLAPPGITPLHEQAVKTKTPSVKDPGKGVFSILCTVPSSWVSTYFYHVPN